MRKRRHSVSQLIRRTAPLRRGRQKTLAKPPPSGHLLARSLGHRADGAPSPRWLPSGVKRWLKREDANGLAPAADGADHGRVDDGAQPPEGPLTVSVESVRDEAI